jgi:hypothetical protein
MQGAWAWSSDEPEPILLEYFFFVSFLKEFFGLGDFWIYFICIRESIHTLDYTHSAWQNI